MHKINICSFPTTIVIVDDNEKFLNNLKMILEHQDSNYLFFSNPHNALEYLERAKENLIQNDVGKKNISVEADEYDTYSVDLHINNLHKEIYNLDRFKKLSLLITDYDMPGINGVELCQKLNDSAVIRVLLTGVAEDITAIDAFNQGSIEQFIKKHDPLVIDNLRSLIKKSQEKYFAQVSTHYNQAYSFSESYINILSNSIFIKLFFDLIKENEIVEYYALDFSASFLMLTKGGKVSALYLSNPAQHEAMIYFAESENCPNEILDKLKNKTHSLWFYENPENSISKISDEVNWSNHLLPIKEIVLDKQILYYSYSKNVPLIDQNKVQSFEKFKLDLS